jgi:hypothetical protein
MFWSVVLSVAVFGGFFVLRGIAATVVFYYLLDGDSRCPHCDAETLRVESGAWNRLLPWFRTSWCYECGWEGVLRPDASKGHRHAEPRSAERPTPRA